jgi:hypothetical protein
MMYGIYSDYDGYSINLDYPESGEYQIDFTQKFLDRYRAYEAEREFIQSKLHRYYTEARAKKQLEECQKGIPSKGF